MSETARKIMIVAGEPSGGVQTGNRIDYPTPPTEQPSLRGVCRSVDCQQAERVARRCPSLPMFPERRLQDAERVAAAVATVAAEALDRSRR